MLDLKICSTTARKVAAAATRRMRMKLGGLSLLALTIVGHPFRSRELLLVSAEDGEPQDEVGYL